MPTAPRSPGPGATANTAGWEKASADWALPFLVAIMDTAWITPYALLAGTVWLPAGASLLSPVAILALLAGGQVLTRRSLASAGERRARALLVALGVLAATGLVAWQYGDAAWWRPHDPLWRVAASALTGSRPEVPAWVAAMLVWRRGLVLGRTTLDYYDVEPVFYLGLGAFGVFAAIMAAGTSVPVLAAMATAALPYLLLFFAASLLALPLARLQSVQRFTRASVRRTTGYGGWYGLLAAVVIGLLGIAVAAGAVLRLDVGALFRALGPALSVLLVLGLYAIALPVGLIISAVIWVIRLLFHPRSISSLPPLSPPGWLQQLQSHETAGLPPNAAAALRWGAAVILLVVGLLWLARSVFRYGRTGRGVAADVSRESVWSWADLRASWRTLFRNPLRARPVSPPADYGTGGAGTVRRCYAEFLTLAAAFGSPRRASQTPAEFAGAVCAAHPDVAGATDTLTAVYSAVRYGLMAPSPDEVEIARAALEHVRAARSAGPDGGPPRRGAPG